MAKMIPHQPTADTKSTAEKRLFKALAEQLPASYNYQTKRDGAAHQFSKCTQGIHHESFWFYAQQYPFNPCLHHP